MDWGNGGLGLEPHTCPVVGRSNNIVLHSLDLIIDEAISLLVAVENIVRAPTINTYLGGIHGAAGRVTEEQDTVIKPLTALCYPTHLRHQLPLPTSTLSLTFLASS